jgi:hydrogenase maturation protease
MTEPCILVFGIGNPGRQDDGMGAALVESLQARHLPGVTCRARYQLNLEDAKLCADHDIVVFSDAAGDIVESFALSPLEPSTYVPISTHSFRPEAILAVCETHFGKKPRAFLLAIRGYQWGLEEGLSPQGAENLKAAFEALLVFLSAQVRNGHSAPDQIDPKDPSCQKKKFSS